MATGGALNLTDTFGGNVSISSQQSGIVPLNGLLFTGKSGVNTATLTIGNLTTSKGDLIITNNNGNIAVGNGATVDCFDGNILIQNNYLQGTIDFGQNATMLCSTTGTGGLLIISIGPPPFLAVSAGRHRARSTRLSQLVAAQMYFIAAQPFHRGQLQVMA